MRRERRRKRGTVWGMRLHVVCECIEVRRGQKGNLGECRSTKGTEGKW